MDKLTTFDKIQKTLFEDPEDENSIVLSQKEIEIRERYKKVFTYWLNKPYLLDSQVRRFMMFEMSMSKSQAYRDFPKIELLLGNVKTANKEFIRWQLTQMSLETYALAKKKGDTQGMNGAISNIGKYNKLDKEELDAIPWKEIQLPQLEPSADIKILDPKLKEYTDAERERLKKKFLSRQDIEEAEIIN